MTTLVGALRSSVGKKFLMGFTGLVWVGFVIGHLIGNLLLLVGKDAFNGYALFLETVGHGGALYVAEAFLVVTLLIHVFNGVGIAMNRGEARPEGYVVNANAGGRSRKGLASQAMIWTGIFLLGFLIFHIATFKFSHLIDPRHTPRYHVPGNPDHPNLYLVVVQRFSQPWYVAIYTFVMLLLGLHLKHGIWSGLQSLGLLTRKTLPVAVVAATVLSALLAVGFLLLPIIIFAFNETFAEGPGGLFHL